LYIDCKVEVLLFQMRIVAR